jgi:hypothetical protein
MAACAPASLDYAFRRDLTVAVAYSVRRGRLYVDLADGTGTMEFRAE